MLSSNPSFAPCTTTLIKFLPCFLPTLSSLPTLVSLLVNQVDKGRGPLSFCQGFCIQEVLGTAVVTVALRGGDRREGKQAAPGVFPLGGSSLVGEVDGLVREFQVLGSAGLRGTTRT